MLQRIHAEFPKLRPDLRHSTDEIRLERLAFCERTLNLRKPLASMRHLTDEQLGRVIEAIKREMSAPVLPGCAVHHFKARVETNDLSGCGPEQMAAIHHLAGQEQVWAIKRMLTHLRWGTEATENFISRRFKRRSPEMLSPKQANSMLMILFNIAASNDLKKQHGEATAITSVMKARYIPELKRKLGIDQGTAK